ncbi:UNVERIFIED_ORG: flavin reductase (DIM6/NTAB) family NADH-FMN oxidoreductase RutF [Xanthobacter viscosus]|jgi:flavin reductase (DIM6/NTAB) family NADH-FMN oxidoreductase RutF|uniref:Flavin reductase family protein n=1 Tax=Xanthobacter autotrophicus TaxID=280 RepID=A0A6C1KQV6_XANAU|nr:flavin reductase family protein [Xanthobacter autotrophicus]TLX42226.1 flavin reductase family protein [Xanthobacter autotrophicus]
MSAIPADPFDTRAFRCTLGAFATGVAIVAAEGEDGTLVGMTMSSFNAVSLDPPLVLFSVARAALSLPALKSARAYGISVLAHHQQDLSGRFARAQGEKWAGVAHLRGAGGAPLIAEAAAHLECAPHAIHDGGDHEIFIARVLAHRCEPEAAPLVFHAGRYRSLSAIAS